MAFAETGSGSALSAAENGQKPEAIAAHQIGQVLHEAATGFAALDSDNRVQSHNPAFALLLCSAENEPFVGACLIDMVRAARTGLEPADVEPELQAMLEDDGPSSVEFETAGQGWLVLRLEARRSDRRVLIAEDITETVNKRRRAASEARIDPLTRLGNRKALIEALMPWTSGHDCEGALALVLFDLDGFAAIRDELGPEMGDELVKLVARRLEIAVRPSDVIVRLGDDEFVIVQRGGEQPQGSESLARRTIALMKKPFVIGGQNLIIGATAGLAVLERPNGRAEDLMKRVHLALFHAKAEGRGCYRHYDPSME
ncbi:MAG: diguanylate cyclase domain-containing protein [Geminicoccaceae bacterium]